MTLHHSTRRITRTALAGTLAVSAFGLSACGSDDTSGTEEGVDVEDIQEEDVDPDSVYDGVYDTTFYEEVGTYDGEEVTVSADVNEIISSTSFTIAGTEDTDVEPMLVVSAEENADLEEEQTIGVTGTVQTAFELTVVEDDLGIDLDDEAYADWEGQPYLVASSIDTEITQDDQDT